jgi:hypothetical protein
MRSYGTDAAPLKHSFQSILHSRAGLAVFRFDLERHHYSDMHIVGGN